MTDDVRADPSQATLAANASVAATLPFHNKTDFLEAQRGKIAELDPQTVYQFDNPQAVSWDLTQYANQLQNDDGTYPPCPDSVNPSLWRAALLNVISGVFELVPEYVFQVRGYDIANMTAVRSSAGWIIIDPITTAECAAAALQNLNRAFRNKYPTQVSPGQYIPVAAVMFSHSHQDHFAGVWGLAPNRDHIEELPFPAYAPPNFLHEVVTEKAFGGTAMIRRATYMYGGLLQVADNGQVDNGLGKTLGVGRAGLVPAIEIDFAGNDLAEITIGNVVVQFYNVPNSEAPSEMLFYFPQYKTLCGSEVISRTFHNILTLRGAEIRDALLWYKYLHQTLHHFPDMEVVCASHHWPVWNRTESGAPFPENRCLHLIKKMRDMYKFVHDQTMRFTNKGYTIQDVAEAVQIPPSLGHEWFNRGLYGTVIHNCKSVYQRYLGWFDGNPASLHQLPPAHASANFLRYMGSLSSIMQTAQSDYDQGNYRGVSMVLNTVIFGTQRDFVDGNLSAQDRITRHQAIQLLANTYDQMGYQAEAGPWRNFYLTGAKELRNGGSLGSGSKSLFDADTTKCMSLQAIGDHIGVLLNPETIADNHYIFNVYITPVFDIHNKNNVNFSTNETGHMKWELKNSVLITDTDLLHTDSDLTAAMAMTRQSLNEFVMGTSGTDLLDANKIYVHPIEAKPTVRKFFNAMQQPDPWFNIVFPNFF